MDEQRRLKACFARCTATDDYLDTFYEVFLSRSKTARDRFADVDLAQQKQRLASALPRLLAIADIDPESPVAEQARDSHSRHHQGKEPTDYATWIGALCETFRRHDSTFDDELEAALTNRLRRSVLIINPEAKV